MKRHKSLFGASTLNSPFWRAIAWRAIAFMCNYEPYVKYSDYLKNSHQTCERCPRYLQARAQTKCKMSVHERRLKFSGRNVDFTPVTEGISPNS